MLAAPSAAISPAVTITVASVAALAGLALIALGPRLATRAALAVDPEASGSRAVTQCVTLFCIECVACGCLFTAVKAFGLIPTFATVEKIAFIALAALCLTVLTVLSTALDLGRRGARGAGKRP